MTPGLKFPLVILLSILFLSACRTGVGPTYAIRDFRPALQPALVTIVSNCILDDYDSASKFIINHASNEELKQLSASEHPLLRALALKAMLGKPGFDSYRVMMEHLDDTAVVAEDMGEFGSQYIKVSDFLIQQGTWKSHADKEKTVAEVLLHHNYLDAAYTISDKIPAQERYYSSIRAMAQRDERFDMLEHALYSLAQFKKLTDTGLIKTKLMENTWRMSEPSFRLMRDYPNDTYLDVLEKYYRPFYRNISWAKGGMTENGGYYFDALASYKEQRSAVVLERILNRKPFCNGPVDTVSLKYHLRDAIWSNPCPAYAKLREQIKQQVAKDKKDNIEIPVEPLIDTFPEIIRWWY
ncbi:MAG TPA: hypothetical protein VGM41_09300 [Chitinophagaceae bacterium]|jgi:hypothetical protein